MAEWRDSGESVTVQTSGSTGKPKRLQLPKKLMKESALRTNAFFSIDAGSRIHSCVAFDYIGGKMTAVRAEMAGCLLTSENPSNRPALSGSEQPIDLLSVVASQMEYLLEHRQELPEVRNYLIGGSAIPSGIRKKIAESGIRAWESYGMTETASHIAVRRVTEEEIPFTPLPGIEIRQDERGCLVIRMEGWPDVVTNDICEITPEGFRILGRADNVIISGGKKFHPEEAERKLSEYLDFPFYFTSKKDEKWGEAIVLICEADETDHVKEICEKELEHWQQPKEIRFVDRLPRTENGKIRRH